MYKVIIIEDDPMVASINKQYVELTSSFHVEATFKNGILALQYLQNCTVDLIILDYYTPQMNGDEFIDQLHAAGMTPAIIMVTSANDAETVRRLYPAASPIISSNHLNMTVSKLPWNDLRNVRRN